MKLVIINGNPDPGNSIFEDYIRGLEESLKTNNETETFTLREKDIKYCTGCWGCWVKTPGECLSKDDSHEICARIIHSDFVLFVSPVIMGFTSALLKKLQDKMIPLLHPYIEIVEDECHHHKRYESYPALGLLIQREENTDDDDIKIISDIYKRLSLNFRSELKFTGIMNNNPEEAADEINSL